MIMITEKELGIKLHNPAFLDGGLKLFGVALTNYDLLDN